MSFSISRRIRISSAPSPQVLSSGTEERIDRKANSDSIIPSVENASLIKDWMQNTYKPSWFSDDSISAKGREVWPNPEDPLNIQPYERPVVIGVRGLTSGCVNLFDGRVFMINERSGRFALYSPSDQSFELLPDYGSPISDNGAFYGGIRANDGRVILLPSGATQIGIFDPQTKNITLENPTGLNAASGASFAGGSLLPDGRVLFAPRDETAVGLYNPDTNTYNSVTIEQSIIDNSDPGYYVTSTVLQDGKVVLCPFTATHIGLFDPGTNTFTKGPQVPEPNNNIYRDAILAPNGNVIFVPRNRTKMGVYTPPAPGTDGIGTFKEIDLTSKLPTGFQSGALFDGGILLPSGNILLCSRGQQGTLRRFGVFNTYTEEFSLEGPRTEQFLDRNGEPGIGFRTMCLCHDGTILCVPILDASPVILQSTTIPENNTLTLLESSHSR